MTEFRFRCYWERTDKKAKDEVRFAAVLKLMEHDLQVSGGRWNKDLTKKLLEKAADGKWRALAKIAAMIEEPEEAVATRLELIKKHGSYGTYVESRPAGDGRQFRLVRGGGIARLVGVGRVGLATVG